MILPENFGSLARRARHTLLTEDQVMKSIRRNPYYELPFGKDRLWGAIQANGMFQFWTKEFIEEFAQYLKERTSPGAIVLDVGAGNGLLTFWLEKSGVPIQAVDNQSWGEWSKKWQIEYPDWVIDMDYKEALKKFSPEIVISSWMPSYVDWTPDFRNYPSVREYILIGEAPKPPRIRPHNTTLHCSVGEWESWDEFSGWKKTEIKTLTKRSLSYYELLGQKEVDHFYYNSHVISFRRI